MADTTKPEVLIDGPFCREGIRPDFFLRCSRCRAEFRDAGLMATRRLCVACDKAGKPKRGVT